MELGLAGHNSSLDMIPTYLTCGVPAPGSKAAVIDAGGTNFRVALVAFTEGGPVIERMERYAMPGLGGRGHLAGLHRLFRRKAAALPR